MKKNVGMRKGEVGSVCCFSSLRDLRGGSVCIEKTFHDTWMEKISPEQNSEPVP